jgi:hypothetical protein
MKRFRVTGVTPGLSSHRERQSRVAIPRVGGGIAKPALTELEKGALCALTMTGSLYLPSLASDAISELATMKSRVPI